MRSSGFFLIFSAGILFAMSAGAEDIRVGTCDLASLKQQAEQALDAGGQDKIYFQLPEAGCRYRDRFYGEEHFTKRFSVERNPEQEHHYNFFTENVNGKTPEVGTSYATDGKSLLRMLKLEPVQ